MFLKTLKVIPILKKTYFWGFISLKVLTKLIANLKADYLQNAY
jgi:hypothetical protein